MYGSPIADTIAYTRPDEFVISGTAKRAGRITIVEKVRVSSDLSTLTMRYSMRNRDGKEANSIAVFKRETGKPELCTHTQAV